MKEQVLKKSFFNMKKAEEEDIRTKYPLGFVPSSNPNELQTTDRNTTQGPCMPGIRRVVSSARHQDTSPGAEALSRPGRHPPAILEEWCPGVVRVSGIGDVEGDEEQEATVATSEEPTVNITARVVVPEEENRSFCAQERLLLDSNQLLRERDQLRRITGNEVIVDPVVLTSRDVEDGSKEVTQGATNDKSLPKNNRCKWGTRGRRLLAIGAILLTVVAIVVTLVIVLRPDPTELECTQMANGTCRLEDYPVQGFHVDFSCPASASSVSDCSTCVIVSDDNANQCTGCTVCSEIVAYDCSNIAEDYCVIMDCAGKCEGSPPTPTKPTPTDPNPTDESQRAQECSEMADGSLTCRVEDVPAERFNVDFSCPASTSVLTDCSTCVVVSDDNANQCSSCTVCSASDIMSASYDCANLLPEDECAITDCNKICKNSPSTPTESPEDTMLCSEMADGSLTCRAEDAPAEGLNIDFRCPASAVTSDVCYTCAISTDDNADQCTSCTICSGGLAFDCSNLLPEWECAIMDCDGNCKLRTDGTAGALIGVVVADDDAG